MRVGNLVEFLEREVWSDLSFREGGVWGKAWRAFPLGWVVIRGGDNKQARSLLIPLNLGMLELLGLLLSGEEIQGERSFLEPGEAFRVLQMRGWTPAVDFIDSGTGVRETTYSLPIGDGVMNLTRFITPSGETEFLFIDTSE